MRRYKELKIVKRAKTACLISHMNPDADAIASLVLMKNLLLDLGVTRVDIFTETNAKLDNFDILTDPKLINVRTSMTYDVAVMMDCASTGRLGKYLPIFKSSKIKINIDHHDTNTREGDINIVETVSSTCEILYRIMREFKYKFTLQDFSCIYSGIITDTDNLTVGKISKDTFNVIGECFKAGIDNKALYKRFFASNNLKTMHVLALAIKNITAYEDGKILITHISREEEINLNSHDEDYEGVINQLSKTKDCELIAFIKPRNDEYYISMRARADHDVASVAIKNGGGGHKGAAAFSSASDIYTIQDTVLSDFRELLKKKDTIEIN